MITINIQVVLLMTFCVMMLMISYTRTEGDKDRMKNSEWQPWSECSTTCGEGTRSREKKCVKGEDDGYKCDKVEDKSYQVEKCHEWSPFQRDKCPNPCDRNSDEYSNIEELKHCPDRAKCTDTSEDIGPKRNASALWDINWMKRIGSAKKNLLKSQLHVQFQF
ncbi:hypothetical protein HNY73_004056 [Argiope bruennichi]|uniref:Uncharacterized protein n=1 Tax=Argiope bruennichi TaxID=94029 RepID=A0A8T0FQ46_ARGBR|nr:hypothetical protein HNY73_004056 [Argiope bruennichi]